MPGNYCSSPYYIIANTGQPWVMKRESNPLRNYARNAGEHWATIDKNFQAIAPLPNVPYDSLSHIFYCYPEKMRVLGDEAKPQSSGGLKNNESNLYPGVYKITSDKPGTACKDVAPVYIKLPTSTGGENFLYNVGPDLMSIRGGSGFDPNDGVDRFNGPWHQYFYPNHTGDYRDFYWLTQASFGFNDPGINNPIDYSTENFITHNPAKVADFWAKRRAVLTFQNGTEPKDVKHHEIMDFLPITRPQPPALPSPFPLDVARFARELTKYVELLQVYNTRLRDSLDCILFDEFGPDVTPVEFSDDLINGTKVYEVCNDRPSNVANTRPEYLLPEINYDADFGIKYTVRYGLRTYIRFRCFTYKFSQAVPLRKISLMWHALPDTYNITIYIKRK